MSLGRAHEPHREAPIGARRSCRPAPRSGRGRAVAEFSRSRLRTWIDAGELTVGRPHGRSPPAAQGGRGARARHGARGGRRAQSRADPARHRLRRRGAARHRQARRVGRPPRCRQSLRHVAERLAAPVSRARGPAARRSRPPPRQGHERPAARRAHADEPDRAQSRRSNDATSSALIAPFVRACSPAAAASTRRSEGIGASARRWPSPRAAAPRVRTIESSSDFARTRTARSSSKPGARIRSGCTWPTSARRCWVTPSTAAGQSCRPRPSVELRTALQGFRRQALHASRLRLAHPVTGAALDLQSALAPDLAALLDLLRVDAAGAAR